MKPKDKIKQLESALTKALPALPEEVDSVTDKLNFRQRLFVIRYTQHHNATQAAKEAGYGVKGAHTKANWLLKQPAVQLAILKRIQALEIASTVTREYVLCELVEIVEELKASPKPSYSLQLKALETIAKVAGFSGPDTQVNIQNNIDSIKIEIVRPSTPTIDQNGSQD